MNLLNEIDSDLTGLEQLKVMMTEDRRPGIGETLDIRLVEVEEGRVVLEATPDVHLYNPIGTVHGGFATTMLDFACGYGHRLRGIPRGSGRVSSADRRGSGEKHRRRKGEVR